MSLPIELLRVVHAIASKGSITLAAEMLEVSQPAVSKQLRQLEKRAGVQLVERRGRGVALTREGELVADYAGRMFALLAEAESALGDLQGLRRGHLAIGAGTTVGVYALPEAIVRFRQRFPGVELRTEVGA